LPAAAAVAVVVAVAGGAPEVAGAADAGAGAEVEEAGFEAEEVLWPTDPEEPFAGLEEEEEEEEEGLLVEEPLAAPLAGEDVVFLVPVAVAAAVAALGVSFFAGVAAVAVAVAGLAVAVVAGEAEAAEVDLVEGAEVPRGFMPMSSARRLDNKRLYSFSAVIPAA